LTTSEYLQVQAELLVTAAGLRKMPLEEFAARARELASGGALVDRWGARVECDAAYVCAVAEAAMEFRERVRRGPGVSRAACAGGDACATKTRRRA
jgi:hypothetical protein